MAQTLTRRALLSAVAILAAAPSVAQADSAVAFVRDFYTREIARHAANEGSSEPDFLAVFTADAQRLWRAAQANRNRANEPAGPILHAFFGQGALPGREITLGAVAGSGRNAVSVALTIQGNPRTLVVHIAREGGAWRIADIDYGGDSFVAYFRRRAGQ
ncbi:MAG: hypothetical protein K2Z80_33290 [Xanthobacteraceae bacterium]|nr:hypothetical protein [Xanthobacteraceae bacterium]